VAQRSLAVIGLGEHFSVGRHDIESLTEPPAPVNAVEGMTIRTAGEGDLEGVCAVDETPPRLVLERMRRGDLVYVGVTDRRVVCHAWFHRGPRPFTEDEPMLARWALPARTFWSYAGATAPEARRLGLLPQVLRTGLVDLFELHGAAQVLCRVSRANTMSLLLHERLGFKRLGTVTVVASPWGRSLVWLGASPGSISKRFVLGPNSQESIGLPP
jgi:hypothetical protein